MPKTKSVFDSKCICAFTVATNDTSKSLEPRAPLAEMEDIEVTKKKQKPAEVRRHPLVIDVDRALLFSSSSLTVAHVNWTNNNNKNKNN